LLLHVTVMRTNGNLLGSVRLELPIEGFKVNIALERFPAFDHVSFLPQQIDGLCASEEDMTHGGVKVHVSEDRIAHLSQA
jgi:hypothetical protein